jgi:putative glutamine amidotransferase
MAVSHVSVPNAPRPLIGVTVRNRPKRTVPPYLAVNTAYVTGLQAAGADVVLLPPSPTGVPRALLDHLDGLLLPGGVDVDPSVYGERPREGLGEVDHELDAFEVGLARTGIERRLRLLGICRGQQVINVALGGTLYQDLARDGATVLPHASPPEKGRDYLAHEIDVTPGSHLREALCADRLPVNSHHHQAVRRVAPDLRVTAVSTSDGIVEGLESADGLVLAVQCHPEELTAHAWARHLFSAFVETAAGRRVTA